MFHGQRIALTGDPLPLRQGFLEFKGQAVVLASGLVMELMAEPQQKILGPGQNTPVVPGQQTGLFQGEKIRGVKESLPDPEQQVQIAQSPQSLF